MNWVGRGSALSLGVARSIVHGTFLISTLATSFSALGQLPVTILRPTGLMQLLPWSFYDRLLTPSGMTVFKGVMLLSLLLSNVRISNFVFNQAFVCARPFLPGISAEFWSLQPRRNVGGLLPGCARIYSVWRSLFAGPLDKAEASQPTRVCIWLSHFAYAAIDGVALFQFGAGEAACGWIEILESRQFSGVGYLSLARQFARHEFQTRFLVAAYSPGVTSHSWTSPTVGTCVSTRRVLASFALVDTWVWRLVSLGDNVLHELVLSISTGNVFDLRRLGESGRLAQSTA